MSNHPESGKKQEGRICYLLMWGIIKLVIGQRTECSGAELGVTSQK